MASSVEWAFGVLQPKAMVSTLRPCCLNLARKVATSTPACMAMVLGAVPFCFS